MFRVVGFVFYDAARTVRKARNTNRYEMREVERYSALRDGLVPTRGVVNVGEGVARRAQRTHGFLDGG